MNAIAWEGASKQNGAPKKSHLLVCVCVGVCVCVRGVGGDVGVVMPHTIKII